MIRKAFRLRGTPIQSLCTECCLLLRDALGFFLSEAFKEAVSGGVVAGQSYPTMGAPKRKVIDLAAKIVRTGGRTILKVAQAFWDRLNLPVVWQGSGCQPKICWE